MICTKCNSEIPNGAKFCPVCGNACGAVSDVKPAAESPETDAKTYCGKCGLELNRGAKFCAVCGASAAVGSVKENANDGSTFGRGDMSAVSLDKPDVSDSLVAAMNTAASSTAVPMPSDSVPVPSNSVPVPSGNSSGFSSGFSGSGTGYGSPAPSFIPESPAASGMAAPFGANDNPFGDMGAAAIVATPIKKRTGLKVGIIIASIAAVLIAAAAVFFFTNKATALSLIMGKPNYAAMVEGNSIKEAAEKLDAPALSDGIKSASGLVASLVSIGEEYEPDLGDIDDSFGGFAGMSNTNTATIKMAHTMSMYSGNAIDLETIISSYYQAMIDAYGMNSVKATVSVNADIADSVKSMLGEEADEILELINGLNVSAEVSVSKDTVAAQMDASSGSAVVNARTVFTADGDVYLVLPFVGDKALKVKIPTEKSAQTAEIKPLELDAKEIERLIGEMVELYVKEYKESAIEMGDGELTAAGLTAKGKLITAEFSGKKLAALFGNLAEHFADDEYFSAKIIEFANEYGAELTKEEYKNEIMSAFDPDDFDDSDKLIISTVIDNNGNVLAKSWKALSNSETVELVYVDSKEQITFEIKDNDEAVLSVVADVVSDKEGAVSVKCGSSDGVISFTVSYSDISIAQFCGKDTFTGNYTISMDIPDDFSESAGVLSGMKFTVSNAVDSDNTMESTISAVAGSYGSVTLKSTVTASNDDALLAVPTDVIDLGNGEDQPDEATMIALTEYLESIGKKLEEMKDGPFGAIYESFTNSIIGVGGVTGGEVSFDDVYNLTDDISQTMSDVVGFSYKYGVYEDDLDERAGDIRDELNDLYSEIVNKDWKLTTAEFTDYTNKYNTIKSKADALEKDYKAAQSANPVAPVNPSGSSADSLNFDNMTDDDLYEIINEYGERYLAVLTNYENAMKIASDVELGKLSDTAETTYNKVVDDYVQFIESYSDGNYSIALLRNVRKSAKAFALAVEALEKALMTQA